GVGGTRNCDWWFTDEAVLLDTAGRYTTQDSFSEVDKAAWGGFLQLLKRHRRRRPINGVIVALSVADLLQQGDTARRAQALAIRARIKELHEELGIRFPVYVIVTKCDLLAGFIEYFDNLGRDERSQVWGVTFPLSAPDAAAGMLEQFSTEFAALEQQLQVRLFARMQQERDVQRRALIYNFPQQFAAIGEVLDVFLNDVFGTTAYEEAALLRGVYFTSGTQEGSPIDRVMATLAASFGLDRRVLPVNAFGGRSYFITRLLREVIFPEAELAGANLKLERNRRILQWGAMAGAALLLAVTSAGLLTSYVGNKAYVKDVAARTEDIDKLAKAVPDQPSPLVTLALLNAVRDIPGGYKDRNADVPLSMGLGLYQGDKLGEGATGAYRRVLRQALMPRIVSRMEDELRRDGANNADYLYELLRVYLMLGERSHFDADAVRAWIDFDWSRNLADSNEVQRQELSGHVAALLDQNSAGDAPPQLDAALIAQTRLTLAKIPVAARIYNRIKRDMASAKLQEFDVSSVAGRDAALVLTRQSGQPLTRGIPGTFTAVGYKKFLEQIDLAIADAVKDSWVLDRREAIDSLDSAAQTKATITQMYYDEYIRQWDNLLADVVIIPFNGLDQAARVVSLLSGTESPLRKFLQAASRQTSLDKLQVAKSSVTMASDAVKSLRDAATKRLEAALSSGTEAAPQVDAKPLNPVDAHFDALHKMVEAGAGGAGGGAAPSGLDGVLVKLKDVATYFDAANSAKAAGTPPPPADALNKLKRDADGMPAPLSTMLKTLDNTGAGLTAGTERGRLDAIWTANAAPFCKRAIEGRYPMLRTATEEVTPDDFGRFFGPGGMVDEFFQKNLQTYVDTGGPRWRWRVVNNATLDISQETLDEFQRAATVRDRFFASGGRQASMRFELKPQTMDATLTKLTLEIDGQTLSYAPKEALRGTPFQLPSGKNTNQVRFDTAPPLSADFKTDGPWAWFRMIDKGVLEKTAQAERFKLSYDLEERTVVFDLTASSVNNPFRRDAIEKFHCLDHL
ncbi:MAG: type VI secretion system membrane subunit TssM, partial [Pseudomonadota bacterium]